MEDKDYNNELDKLIRASMEITNIPSPELNNRLKLKLYEQEKVIHNQTKTHDISLWYMPMILNFLTFSLFSVLALLTITNPYISKLVSALCGYISIAGIIITVVGVKRTNMREEITIHIKKRGDLA